MKKTTMFGVEALEEVQAALCDFHNTLMNRAAERAEKSGRKLVTRKDIELTVEELIDGPDA